MGTHCVVCGVVLKQSHGITPPMSAFSRPTGFCFGGSISVIFVIVGCSPSKHDCCFLCWFHAACVNITRPGGSKCAVRPPRFLQGRAASFSAARGSIEVVVVLSPEGEEHWRCILFGFGANCDGDVVNTDSRCAPRFKLLTCFGVHQIAEKF